jgi:triacylglycerol lipase
MSVLVELARSAYPDDALNRFTATKQFGLDNARTMMWLSQLAYETADKSKVKNILDAWRLTMHEFIANDPKTGFPPKSACVVVAGGRGATFVTFAGSDPLKFEDWITDFDAVKSATDVHDGFQETIKNVWPTIEAAIKTAITNRPTSEQNLFFTGHSLGGALAIVAAAHLRANAAPEIKGLPTTVYTFGSPRTGGAGFFGEYPLNDFTFRLVHGTDIVATVPAPQPGDYRHVGQCMQCQTGGIFDAQTPVLTPDENKPDVIESSIQAGIDGFRSLAAFRLIRHIGPRPLDLLAGLLPTMVRDHVPANYFRALSIPLH